MASTNTKVVKVRDAYEEIVSQVLRAQRWALRAFDAHYYAYSIPGTSWPVDLDLFWSVFHHFGDDLQVWFQMQSGGPFKRYDWEGLYHLGPDIEARALGQGKQRQPGVFVGRAFENRMRIRVPHR